MRSKMDDAIIVCVSFSARVTSCVLVRKESMCIWQDLGYVLTPTAYSEKQARVVHTRQSSLTEMFYIILNDCIILGDKIGRQCVNVRELGQISRRNLL